MKGLFSMYPFILIICLLVLLVIFFITRYIRGGDKQMLVMLMAINIISEHYTWERVPRLLKDQVREQLELMGAGDLAGE